MDNMNHNEKKSYRRTLFEIIESSDDQSRYSLYYDIFMLVTIVASIVFCDE